MEIPRHWRIQKQRYALAGEICPHCDAKIFPPRPVCTYCGSNLNEKSIHDKNITIEINSLMPVQVNVTTS